MTDIHSPHDKFFKSAMQDCRVSQDFFEHHLPDAIKKVIDWNSLTLQPTTYIDGSMRLSMSDLLFAVKLAEENAYLYVLVEHQSTADYLMPYRLLEYMVGIWRNEIKQDSNIKKLPLIIPLVFFHGKTVYNAPRTMEELIQAPSHLIETFLFKSFILIDTHTLSDDELKKRYWSGLMTYLLKQAGKRDSMLVMHTILKEIQLLERDGALNYIKLLLNYVLETSEISPEELLRIIKENFSEKEDNTLMTLAEQLRAEGMKQGMKLAEQLRAEGLQQGMKLAEQSRAEGLQQGMKLAEQSRVEWMQQGIIEGECAVLLRQLKCKFHEVPHDTFSRIKKLNAERLLRFAEKIIDAKSLDELFDE